MQDWSNVRIKKELETLRIPSLIGKQRWPVSTIGDILSNDKYAGDSVFSRTMVAEYPAVKRIKNQPEEIQRSENHHDAIIDRETFDRVQEMKKSRTNIELDEHGNRIRKSSHYRMKRASGNGKEMTESV